VSGHLRQPRVGNVWRWLGATPCGDAFGLGVLVSIFACYIQSMVSVL